MADAPSATTPGRQPRAALRPARSFEDPGLAKPMCQLVGGDHHRRADDALDQASCARDPPLATNHTAEVDVRIHDLGGWRADEFALGQDLLESDGQDLAEA